MSIIYDKRYTNVVKMHNNLVEAHYKFTREQQLILIQVAHTLQKNDVFEKHEHYNKVTYDARELGELLNIPDLRTIRGVVKGLQRCIMSYENLNEHWEEDVNVFVTGRYHAGGQIDIEIHAHMLPFFKKLDEHYTKLNIKELVQFSSQYSIRIYELMRKLQFIPAPASKSKRYAIDEFQQIIGSNYKRWVDLERKIIKPSVEEINNKSRIWVDYKVNYKKVKRGRPPVESITFLMGIKDKHQPTLI